MSEPSVAHPHTSQHSPLPTTPQPPTAPHTPTHSPPQSYPHPQPHSHPHTASPTHPQPHSRWCLVFGGLFGLTRPSHPHNQPAHSTSFCFFVLLCFVVFCFSNWQVFERFSLAASHWITPGHFFVFIVIRFFLFAFKQKLGEPAEEATVRVCVCRFVLVLYGCVCNDHNHDLSE